MTLGQRIRLVTIGTSVVAVMAVLEIALSIYLSLTGGPVDWIMALALPALLLVSLQQLRKLKVITAKKGADFAPPEPKGRMQRRTIVMILAVIGLIGFGFWAYWHIDHVETIGHELILIGVAVAVGGVIAGVLRKARARG